MKTLLIFLLLPFLSTEKPDCTELDLNNVFEKSIYIKNKTRFQMAVSVRFRDTDGDWVTNHLIVNPGVKRRCCTTDNSTMYYYAVDTYGYGWQISGSATYKMNYYNTYVGFRKRNFDSDETFSITLYE